LAEARYDLAEPYRQVGKLSDVAKINLERWKQAGFDARAQWKYFQRSGNPEAMAKAKAADQAKEVFEGMLTREANKAGRGDLVEALQQSKKALAINFQVRNALGKRQAEVSAKAIGDIDMPLTGPLGTIQQFAQKYPQLSGLASKTPAPEVSQARAWGSLAAALLGSLHAGPVGVMAGAIPLVAPPLARKLLLSRALQGGVNIPPNVAPAATAGMEYLGR
jgi:hypothetical protein